jgi:hypothetical protein
VPAAFDPLLRDLGGARSWVSFSNEDSSPKSPPAVIDTSISKVLGCVHTAAYSATPWGGSQVQSNNNEYVQTRCCLNTRMRLRLFRPSGPAYQPRSKEGGR